MDVSTSQPTEGEGQDKGGENAQPSPQPPAAPIAPVNNSPACQPRAPEKAKTEEETIQQKMSAFERSMVRLTTLGIVVGAITLLIFGGQLYEMISGGTQTDHLVNYSKVQADAASDQAEAAQQFSDTAEDINGRIQDAVDQLQAAADNAKTSIRATQAAVRLDQRAWLGTGDETYAVAESGPITSTINATNMGKTPAREVYCHITGTTKVRGYELRDSDILYPPELPTLKQGVIFPGQHFPLTAGGLPMEPSTQKTWFENVQNGTWIQYFYGDLTYKDIFGKDHWTHFCTQFVPSTKSGTPCPIYNDTDDTKKDSAKKKLTKAN